MTITKTKISKTFLVTYLEGFSYYSSKGSDASRYLLGRTISAAGLRCVCVSVWEVGGGGPTDAPLWVQDKTLVGSRLLNTGSSKDLLLWNHLLLIKIYPLKPIMKLIQLIFFSKMLPKFKFEVNFSPWKPCIFAHYL